MNDKSKKLMRDQIQGIVTNLSQFYFPVYEDEIAEDEEKDLDKNGYNCFVFETSEFLPTDNKQQLKQNVYVYYYSENRDDVDETTIDIITSLISLKGVRFVGSSKERLQRNETDRFIDRITISFTRMIPIEYQI